MLNREIDSLATCKESDILNWEGSVSCGVVSITQLYHYCWEWNMRNWAGG